MVILPALPAPHRAGGCGGDPRCVGGFGRTAWRNASPVPHPAVWTIGCVMRRA